MEGSALPVCPDRAKLENQPTVYATEAHVDARKVIALTSILQVTGMTQISILCVKVSRRQINSLQKEIFFDKLTILLYSRVHITFLSFKHGYFLIVILTYIFLLLRFFCFFFFLVIKK